MASIVCLCLILIISLPGKLLDFCHFTVSDWKLILEIYANIGDIVQMPEAASDQSLHCFPT